MSSRLQLDMRHLSLGMRHLVNAYEVEAGIGVIAGNTVWSMPERLECEVLQKARYINTLTLYLLPSDNRAMLCIAQTVVKRCLSVCLSVCLSHGGILSKRLNIILKLFSPLGIHVILVVAVPNSMAVFRRGSPKGGRGMQGYEKLRFSTNISLYLGNDTR